MISKIKEFSKSFRERIFYELAARNCDKDKIKHVEYLGGNLVSGNPYYEFNEGGERKVFVDPGGIILEFEQYASLYKSDSKNLCGHYILSLAEGEKLSRHAWLRVVHEYMEEMGYDDTTKYVAVIHRDTDIEHVHIVTCRVRQVERDASSLRAALGANFQLVSDSNDRHKGMSAAREIEQKHDLKTPKSDGWSKELPRHADPEKDHAHIIRGIAKAVFSASNKPCSMSQLVDRFAERGIQIRVAEKGDQIQGISYKLDRADGRWISGSRVMSTKLTWNALQRSGVSYSPFRDNVKLGVSIGFSQPDVAPSPAFAALFRAYVKISKPRQELGKYVRSRSREFDFFGDKHNYNLGFNFGINFTHRKLKKHEVQAEIENRRLDKMITETMKMVENILQMLFAIFEVKIDLEANIHDLTNTALKLHVPVERDMLGFDAEDEVAEQCRKQLKGIVSQCRYNEKQVVFQNLTLDA